MAGALLRPRLVVPFGVGGVLRRNHLLRAGVVVNGRRHYAIPSQCHGTWSTPGDERDAPAMLTMGPRHEPGLGAAVLWPIAVLLRCWTISTASVATTARSPPAAMIWPPSRWSPSKSSCQLSFRER